MARLSSRTNATGRMMVESANPTPVKVLRTRVGAPPREIQRSESQPDKTLDTATAR